jgi:hypothetical protein
LQQNRRPLNLLRPLTIICLVICFNVSENALLTHKCPVCALISPCPHFPPSHKGRPGKPIPWHVLPRPGVQVNTAYDGCSALASNLRSKGTNLDRGQFYGDQLELYTPSIGGLVVKIWGIKIKMWEDLAVTSSGDGTTEVSSYSHAKSLVPLLNNTTRKEKHLWRADHCSSAAISPVLEQRAKAHFLFYFIF